MILSLSPEPERYHCYNQINNVTLVCSRPGFVSLSHGQKRSRGLVHVASDVCNYCNLDTITALKSIVL